MSTAPLIKTTIFSKKRIILASPAPLLFLIHQGYRLQHLFGDSLDELGWAGENGAQPAIENFDRISNKKVFFGPSGRHVEESSLFLQLLLGVDIVIGRKSSLQSPDDEDRVPLQSLGGMDRGKHQRAFVRIHRQNPIDALHRRLQGHVAEQPLEGGVAHAMPMNGV